jgi:hypothetical protein
LRVQRDGRDFTVELTADGEGLVSHAGAALLADVADRTGLTRALSLGLAGMKERRSGGSPLNPSSSMACAPRTPRRARSPGIWASSRRS